MPNTHMSTAKDKPHDSKVNGNGHAAAHASGRTVKARKARSRSASASSRRRISKPRTPKPMESAGLQARGREMLGNAYTWIADAGHGLPQSFHNIGMPSSRKMMRLIEERPLMIGAIGLGIGLVLGAVLPAAAMARPMLQSGRAASRRK